MNSTAKPAVAPVSRSATVACGIDDAFRIFTDEIGAWWPLPTHGMFGDQAGGVVFRNGQMIEHATDGREAVWAEVTRWEPPHGLALAWHPGRDADESSIVDVSFVADGDRTRVVIEHHGWESFGADAAAHRRGYVGPNAWGYVLDHFEDGVAPQVDAPDLSVLEATYEALFAAFEKGGFGPPPPGEWSAEEVLAHVALNDVAMVAVSQALVHGSPTRFENEVCQDPAVLERWIDRCADAEDMVGRARQCARQLMASLARLSVEQRAEAVHCRLLHDGHVVLDEPRPWGAVAIDVQAGMHLPAHIEQLDDLRG